MESSQFMQYLAVLLLLVLAVGATGGMVALSLLLSKRGARSRIKDTAYECGMIPVPKVSTRFSVQFYLVAMLFILFDVAVVFLYPWAVAYQALLTEHGGAVLGGMLVFLAILFVGYLYALKKKAFDWPR